MKQIISILFAAFTITALSSCSTSQTFTVQGDPGTVILNPENQQIAVLDGRGLANITMNRKVGYYHYLQSVAPGSNLAVPFALDYRDHSRSDKEFWTGYGVMLGSMLGLALMLGGSDGSVVAGGALGLVGVPTGLLMIKQSEKVDAIDKNYDYLEFQRTNSDIMR